MTLAAAGLEIGVSTSGRIRNLGEAQTAMLSPHAATPRDMPLLPSGFGLPPFGYLLVLLLLVGAVLGILVRRRPPVTPQIVVAFTPWMVVGASLYALFQVGALPSTVAPLFGSPAVYLTTFVLAGSIWASTATFPADEWGLRSSPGVLFAIGGAVAGAVIGSALQLALAAESIRLVWPLLGLAVAGGLAFGTWHIASRQFPQVAGTGGPGVLVIFGHVLDGVSTALGTALGFPEQSPLSRLILSIGNALPPAPYIGAGWLFVLVKLGLAVLVAYLLGESLHDSEAGTYLLLGLVAAVGLGPGVHNLVLFAISGG